MKSVRSKLNIDYHNKPAMKKDLVFKTSGLIIRIKSTQWLLFIIKATSKDRLYQVDI